MPLSYTILMLLCRVMLDYLQTVWYLMTHLGH